jgi:outer membrane protein assembly factor BamB
MSHRQLSAFIFSSVCLLGAQLFANDWPQFRGPHFNGTADASDLPAEWSRTDKVLWVADLPGASAASPIVYGDRVFVSSTDAARESVCALCFDRATGKQLWRREIATEIRKDTRSNYASPTPATDGQRVVFFYGNGDLVAFDFNGKELWKRNIQEEFGPFAFMWTFSTSPVLHDGKLFIQVLQRDVPVAGIGLQGQFNESYILALDPASGDVLWRHVRPSDAVAESRESFNTPLPWEYKGRKELVITGGDDISGHDPETGEELWRWGTWNPGRIEHWRHVPSPVAGEDVVLVCAPKSDPVYAIKLGGHGRLGDEAIAWDSAKARQVTSDVPTPAFYEGDFFILSDVKKSLSRVVPATGEVKWSVKTPGRDKFEASPTIADGKIYIVNFVGEVVVVDSDNGEILSIIEMDEPAEDAVRSTVVAAGDQLFIRVNRKLYCIQK